MSTSYEIPNFINQGKNVGTYTNPFFNHITTGRRIKKTIIFHAQIGTKYHKYHIKRVYHITPHHITML